MWRAGVESHGARLLGGERHRCTNDEVKQTKKKKKSLCILELLARVASVSGSVIMFLSAAKLGPFAFLICWGEGLAARFIDRLFSVFLAASRAFPLCSARGRCDLREAGRAHVKVIYSEENPH